MGVECFAFYFNSRAFGHEPRRADKLCPDDGTIDGKRGIRKVQSGGVTPTDGMQSSFFFLRENWILIYGCNVFFLLWGRISIMQGGGHRLLTKIQSGSYICC